MKDILLKGCPHCGGTANLMQNYSPKRRSYFVFVSCSICGAQGKIFNSDEEPAAAQWNNAPCVNAAAAWNMRVTDGGGNNGKETE